MSSTSTYLNNLLKTDLTEFAETSNLSDYAGLRKAELAEKLDAHLKRNATSYGREPSLSEYYRRLSSTTRSPIKRIAEKVSDTIKSDDDAGTDAPAPATARKARRKTRAPTEETTDTEGGNTQRALPPSPAVVTDAIDRQSKRIRSSISHAYEQTGFHEWSDHSRDLLSSTVTINILAILVEAYGLESVLLPNKTISELGPIAYFKSTSTRIRVPDLFQLLEQGFWAPIMLWLLTTVILPALTSYFINIPLQQMPAHSPARRATVKTNPRLQFDPFVFNIAKGLIVYLVYALHLQPLNVFNNATMAVVNTSVPGGYHGMLVSSGIGAAVSLYEAVLKR